MVLRLVRFHFCHLKYLVYNKLLNLIVCGSLANGTFCQTEKGSSCLTTSECTMQGEDFVCETEESAEEKCDKEKCPLHLEMDARQTKAPIQDSQNIGCAI